MENWAAASLLVNMIGSFARIGKAQRGTPQGGQIKGAGWPLIWIGRGKGRVDRAAFKKT
jgi:hypothetical protein